MFKLLFRSCRLTQIFNMAEMFLNLNLEINRITAPFRFYIKLSIKFCYISATSIRLEIFDSAHTCPFALLRIY